MAAKSTRIVSWMYSKHLREKLRTIDTMLIGPTVHFALSFRGSEDRAYTTLAGKDRDILRVVIGGKAVSSVACLPETFVDKKALKPYIGSIKAAFYGLNYHEMGHVLFTDMTLDAITKGLEPKYVGFGMSLFNIFEDPIIELAISKFMEERHPYDISPRKFFDLMKRNVFEPQCKEYRDNGDVGSFMQYLLLAFRCGRKAIDGTNAVYDKYSASLMPMIKGILSEEDATQRQVRTVELAKWIIDNVTEFDWEMPEPKDAPRVSGAGGKGIPGGAPMSVPSGATSGMERGMGSGSGDGKDADGDGKDGEGSEPDEGRGGESRPTDDGEDKDESRDEGKPESKDEGGESGEYGDGSDVMDDADEAFDDLINSAYSHEFVVARDSFVPDDSATQRLDEQIASNEGCIQEVSKFLTLFKGRKKPRRISGFTSGRLDLRRAMNDDIRDGCDTKLFQRDIARGKAVDLAVSLVCDNSGSMCGDKSVLASTAALAVAQACDWSRIPFECSAFTKTWDSMDGTAITIVEKELDEPFQKAKPFFAINDSNLCRKLGNPDRVPVFKGNSEEVNLFHIWRKFRECGHERKLMFVFCDGCTTGSSESLRGVIDRMEADGIAVIGIGLLAPEVAKVYPRHRVFKSLDDMRDNLARFLVETVSDFAMGR